MRLWSINSFHLSTLLGMLMIIFLIQVMPQVDLPDTAFHENRAPAVIKFRVTSGLALTVAPALIGLPTAIPATRIESAPLRAHFVSGSLPVLLCSLLC